MWAFVYLKFNKVPLFTQICQMAPISDFMWWAQTTEITTISRCRASQSDLARNAQFVRWCAVNLTSMLSLWSTLMGTISRHGFSYPKVSLMPWPILWARTRITLTSMPYKEVSLVGSNFLLEIVSPVGNWSHYKDYCRPDATKWIERRGKKGKNAPANGVSKTTRCHSITRMSLCDKT